MRIIIAMLLAWSLPAHGQDAERGRAIYETHCGGCHYERVHERPPERSAVKTLPDLYAQVARWAPRTRLRFTTEDYDDVVEYLNRSHYRLEK